MTEEIEYNEDGTIKEVEEEIIDPEEELDDEEEAPEGEDIDWKARAIKAEGLIQKNKKTVKKAKPITKKSGDSDTLERMQLQIDGYPVEMIDNIIELGGKAALDSNPIVKETVDSMVTQHKAEKASKIDSGTQTSFEKKYSPEDLAGKSIEELEKILPKADE